MVPLDKITLQVMAREVNEIVHAEPLQRMRDADGVEWVARDDLAKAIRTRFMRRINEAGKS